MSFSTGTNHIIFDKYPLFSIVEHSRSPNRQALLVRKLYLLRDLEVENLLLASTLN